MQSYILLNRAIGEIIFVKFKNLKQVEDFLQLHKKSEIMDTDLHGLPFRGTLQVS